MNLKNLVSLYFLWNFCSAIPKSFRSESFIWICQFDKFFKIKFRANILQRPFWIWKFCSNNESIRLTNLSNFSSSFWIFKISRKIRNQRLKKNSLVPSFIKIAENVYRSITWFPDFYSSDVATRIYANK